MFYFSVYYSAYTVKILINISITKPDYFYSVFFQTIGSDIISFLTFRFIMTAAVQLNYQLCAAAEKVSNIAIY